MQEKDAAAELLDENDVKSTLFNFKQNKEYVKDTDHSSSLTKRYYYFINVGEKFNGPSDNHTVSNRNTKPSIFAKRHETKQRTQEDKDHWTSIQMHKWGNRF